MSESEVRRLIRLIKDESSLLRRHDLAGTPPPFLRDRAKHIAGLALDLAAQLGDKEAAELHTCLRKAS